MKTITIASQKGGVGKTVTALAIAAWLHNSGYRTLVVDMDAQGNASMTLNTDRSKGTVLDLLNGSVKASKLLQKTETGYCIPSTKLLSSNNPVGIDGLRNGLKQICNDFDYCIVDTNPSINGVTITGLAAANAIVMPMRADRYSLEAFKDVQDTVKAVNQVYSDVHFIGCLITQYNARATVNQLAANEIEDAAAKNGTTVFKPYIRRCVTLEESEYIPNIFTYSPRSNAAEDYGKAIQQIIGLI